MSVSPKRRPVSPGLIAALLLAAILAAVYVTLRPEGNDETAACPASPGRALALKPLAAGEVAALVLHDAPEPATAIGFIDGDGQPRRLADWRGRTALVNLWATWCAPCRHEMPALDALQARLGGDAFEVIAVNVDFGGPDKGKAFYAEIGLSSLAYYHDEDNAAVRRTRALGLPTTLLVDADGCEIGRLAGPADWASEDALRLVGAALEQ